MVFRRLQMKRPLDAAWTCVGEGDMVKMLVEGTHAFKRGYWKMRLRMVEPSRLPRMFYLPEHSLLRSRYN